MNALAVLLALGVVACGSDGHGGYTGSTGSQSTDPKPAVQGVGLLFDGKVAQAEHTAPVVGGTLLVTRDGQTIVAADPDRDAVFIVDSASRALSSVALQRLDEPGRVAEGPTGTVYVALRRAGALVAIDD